MIPVTVRCWGQIVGHNSMTDKSVLTELKARDTSCPKGKKVELRRIKTIGI